MPSVGNYLVDVQSFEQLALPAIQTVSQLFLFKSLSSLEMK